MLNGVKILCPPLKPVDSDDEAGDTDTKAISLASALFASILADSSPPGAVGVNSQEIPVASRPAPECRTQQPLAATVQEDEADRAQERRAAGGRA